MICYRLTSGRDPGLRRRLGLFLLAAAMGLACRGAAAQTATLTNSGSALLTLGPVAVGGANAGDFALAGDCTAGRQLAPAASCTLSLSFTPAAAGARSASVSIASDAVGSPHALG